jgi:hypothetical protein
VNRYGAANARYTKAIRAIVLALILTLAFHSAAVAAIVMNAPAALTPGQPWELRAKRLNVEYWTVRFNYQTYTVAGPKLTLPLVMPELPESVGSAEPNGRAENDQPEPYNVISTKRIPLEVEATLKSGKTETVSREIAFGSPRDALIAEWIASIQLDDGAERKSGSSSSPGQCKHYLATMFASASAKYELTEAPGITLYLPERPNDAKSGRVEGSAWTTPPLGTGNPFAEVLLYDFDADRSVRENKQAARAMLEGVRPGDVVQLMAIYNNGARGTHTLLITNPYDPMKDMLYWCDSNLKNRMVDGVRYGIVMAYQTRTVEEVIGWLANPLCAATVYRLVDDIGVRPEYMPD